MTARIEIFGEPESTRVLVPFHAREGMTVRDAAIYAGVSDRCIRDWCTRYGLGRRIGHPHVVSRVALAMFLEHDLDALKRYLEGERLIESVAKYFHRFGLSDLLTLPAFVATRAQIQQPAA